MEYRILCLLPVLASGTALPAAAAPSEMAERDRWVAAAFPDCALETQLGASLAVDANYGPVLQNSWCGEPMRIGGQVYDRGLFCHAASRIRVSLPAPARGFSAGAGVVSNFMTAGGQGSVVFTVEAAGEELFRSDVMREGMPPAPVSVPLDGARELVLGIEDGGDGISCDQGAWTDARVTLEDGTVVWVGDLPIVAGQEPPALAAAVPFSFTYDGRVSAELLAEWESSREDVDLDEARHKTTLTWTDPATRLEVRCELVQYRDFPVAEWVLHFANRGDQDTPIVEGIQAIDTAFQRRPVDRPPLGEFILHRNRGDDLNVHNYEPSSQVVGPNEMVQVAAVNGRPTQYVFPYFNLAWLSEGVITVLGWPGQWAAEFVRDGDTGLRVRGGQEIVRTRLRPGEEIRSPLAVLLFWKGDPVHAQNLWRAWMRAHNLPRPDGKPLTSQWNANLLGQTMENSDAASQMRFVEGYAAHDLKIDYWWMDAGWYEGSHEHGWPFVGTWEVERTRFPGGLREVSDRAHSHGMKALVWFEPERVVTGTWLWNEHPEWLLGTDGGTRLLNLGHPEARAWVTQHIGDLIESEGIDLYRQDYNIDPLGFWRQDEPEDRQGITENHYVTGYLALWDALLERLPSLVIDSCASGGRRNDLETMRRSIPKHRSDYIFEPTSQQCMTYALSSWFPIHGSGTLSMDRYELWSTEAPSNTTAWDVTNPDLPYDELKRFGEEFRIVAALQIEGDFYPLTPHSTDNAHWIAWQFHRPDTGEGLMQVFRRPNSIYEAASLPLRGVEPDAEYRVRVLGGEGEWTMLGEEMRQAGVRVSIDARPGVANIVYEPAKH